LPSAVKTGMGLLTSDFTVYSILPVARSHICTALVIPQSSLFPSEERPREQALAPFSSRRVHRSLPLAVSQTWIRSRFALATASVFPVGVHARTVDSSWSDVGRSSQTKRRERPAASSWRRSAPFSRQTACGSPSADQPTHRTFSAS